MQEKYVQIPHIFKYAWFTLTRPEWPINEDKSVFYSILLLFLIKSSSLQ